MTKRLGERYAIRARINADFLLPDWWCTIEQFEDLTPQQFKELIKEDLLSFIEEIPAGGLLAHTSFDLVVRPKEERK
jgi:hypothetical protein